MATGAVSSLAEVRRKGVSTSGKEPARQPRKRVVMLVGNPCVSDSRVIRTAEAVVELGHEVVILAIGSGKEPLNEEINGVRYRRLLPPERRQDPPVVATTPFSRSADGRAESTTVLTALSSASPSPAVVQPQSGTPGRATKSLGIWDIARRLAKRNIPFASEILTTLCRISYRIVRRIIKIVGRFVKIVRRFIKSFAKIKKKFSLHFRSYADTQRVASLFHEEIVRLKPDIIHAHDLLTLPAATGAGRQLGAFMIYDSHELEVHRNTRSGRTDKWMRAFLETRHIKRCNAVVTVCDSIADHLARTYAIERPRVVMNAPEVVATPHTGSTIREDIGLPPETPLAIYVGRITMGRGTEETVRALAHWPELHFALVGGVDKATVARLEDLSRQLGVNQRVHMLPPVAPQRVVSYIRDADISVVLIQNVCLSYYYCLPNKLVESTVADLPVVVSRFPELKRFVECSQSGLVVDETDPEAVATALKAAWVQKDILRPTANGVALRRTLSRYGWLAQKQVLHSLYGEVTGQSFLRGRAATE